MVRNRRHETRRKAAQVRSLVQRSRPPRERPPPAADRPRELLERAEPAELLRRLWAEPVEGDELRRPVEGARLAARLLLSRPELLREVPAEPRRAAREDDELLGSWMRERLEEEDRAVGKRTVDCVLGDEALRLDPDRGDTLALGLAVRERRWEADELVDGGRSLVGVDGPDRLYDVLRSRRGVLVGSRALSADVVVRRVSALRRAPGEPERPELEFPVPVEGVGLVRRGAMERWLPDLLWEGCEEKGSVRRF